MCPLLEGLLCEWNFLQLGSITLSIAYMNSEIQLMSRNTIFRRWCIKLVKKCLKTTHSGSTWEPLLMGKEPSTLWGLSWLIWLRSLLQLSCFSIWDVWESRRDISVARHPRPLTGGLICVCVEPVEWSHSNKFNFSKFKNILRKLTIFK